MEQEPIFISAFNDQLGTNGQPIPARIKPSVYVGTNGKAYLTSIDVYVNGKLYCLTSVLLEDINNAVAEEIRLALLMYEGE